MIARVVSEKAVRTLGFDSNTKCIQISFISSLKWTEWVFVETQMMVSHLITTKHLVCISLCNFLYIASFYSISQHFVISQWAYQKLHIRSKCWRIWIKCMFCVICKGSYYTIYRPMLLLVDFFVSQLTETRYMWEDCWQKTPSLVNCKDNFIGFVSYTFDEISMVESLCSLCSCHFLNLNLSRYTAMHWAAKRGDTDLLSELASPVTTWDSKSFGGYTPLHLACTHNPVFHFFDYGLLTPNDKLI